MAGPGMDGLGERLTRLLRKHLTFRCSVKVDVAACLRAVALFVYLLT